MELLNNSDKQDLCGRFFSVFLIKRKMGLVGMEKPITAAFVVF